MRLDLFLDERSIAAARQVKIPAIGCANSHSRNLATTLPEYFVCSLTGEGEYLVLIEDSVETMEAS